MSIDTTNSTESLSRSSVPLATGQAVAVPLSVSSSVGSISMKQVLADYMQLTKPRIMVMILLTVAVAVLAVPGSTSIWIFFHAMIGTGLVAASASVLNQWFEIDRDAQMPRTAKRPLPDGRLTSFEANMFGWILVLGGTTYLLLFTHWLTALIGLITWASYVWVYTPMKCYSWWNTAVGTIPGALPVMMGWTAAGGEIDALYGWMLTAVLVLWQFPHFMSIAWLYRDQYGKAGYRMLTNADPTGLSAAWHAIIPAFLLMPVVIYLMHPESPMEWLLACIALAVCAVQLHASWRFMQQRTTQTARTLLRSSLIVLPAIMTMVVVRSFF